MMQALTSLLATMYQASESASAAADDAKDDAKDGTACHATSSLPTSSAANDCPKCPAKALTEPALRQACTVHAMPALLRALRDYTTDNRGDVGSL
jgi:hypothetical protein